MKPIIIALALLSTPALADSLPQTTIRDSAGRTVGTVATDSAGNQTIRDAAGRTTGTVTRPSR